MSVATATHVARTSKTALPGTWESTCTCGWKSAVYGTNGARDKAIWARYEHLDDVLSRPTAAPRSNA